MQQRKWTSSHMPIPPTSLYGVGKAFGELLPKHYVETYDISIICLRIGSFFDNPPYPRSLQDDILRAWCSPEDLAQLVSRCLETENLGFQVFYGVSNNKRRSWDIDNARKLVGYHPKSNAENIIKAFRGMDKKRFTQEHILLMQAAIQDGPGSFESWQKWLALVDIEKEPLDSISYRLLPLVYHNLAGQHVEHSLMIRLKGIYRRSWLENQLSLQQVVPFITQLHDRNIPILLLDDLTSILRLYDGQGVRRAYSLDILVQPDDIHRLLRFLEESNIWPKVSYGNSFLKVETPLEIWPPFDLSLSVTWRALPAIKTSEQALAVWQAGTPAVLGNCPVFTLDLETHFLRTCLRAIGARPEAAFFALIDVAWMLGKQADKMDWERVIELTWLNHQVLPVIESLQEIISFTEIAGGDELLQRLRKLPVPWMDRLDYRFINQYQAFPNIFTRVIKRLLLYQRSPKLQWKLGFLRYFQFAWGGGRLLALPRLAVRHFSDSLHRSGKN
jgi:hypothetical protein